MTVERFKSITLFLLVSLSLVQTYYLWYGQKPIHLIADEVFERVAFEKPRSLIEIVTPLQIVVSADRGKYLLKDNDVDFNLLWSKLSGQLQDLGRDDLIDGYIPLEDMRHMLTVYMKPVLPVGNDLPWLADLPLFMVDRLQLYVLNNQKWLILYEANGSNELKLLLSEEQAEELEMLLSGITAQERIAHIAVTGENLKLMLNKELSLEGSLYLPREPVSLRSLRIKPEVLDRDFLLKAFFVDQSLARVIEEKDGGLIYTDGEKGLRLTKAGLDYSHPRMESGQTTMSYSEALAGVGSLISYHGGWPTNYRLASMDLVRRGPSSSYIAEWKMYYNGYQFFIKKPTRAAFHDRGLLHYTRSVYTVETVINESEEESLSIAGWVDALNMAIVYYEDLPSVTEPDIILKAMELGYVIQESGSFYRAKPAWFVKLNDKSFYLQAHDLVLLGEEDLM